jgi:hypothetical protein
MGTGGCATEPADMEELVPGPVPAMSLGKPRKRANGKKANKSASNTAATAKSGVTKSKEVATASIFNPLRVAVLIVILGFLFLAARKISSSGADADPLSSWFN